MKHKIDIIRKTLTDKNTPNLSDAMLALYTIEHRLELAQAMADAINKKLPQTEYDEGLAIALHSWYMGGLE